MCASLLKGRCLHHMQQNEVQHISNWFVFLSVSTERAPIICIAVMQHINNKIQRWEEKLKAYCNCGLVIQEEF